MKTLILLGALLASTSALAGPVENPFENRCSTESMKAKMQKFIIADLRARVAKEQNGNSAYTFKFTPAIDARQLGFGIAVYFETLGETQESRRAYVGSYGLDGETCAPTFQKMQLLVGGSEASAERLNGMGDKETCNYGDGQDLIIARTLRDANWLSPQNLPGSKVTNFAITGVTRVKGAADVTAVYEAARVGLLSTPTLVRSIVDEKTCAPTMIVSTSFVNTIVQY